MSPYRRELPIAAPAATVYAALTTPQGLRGWWTPTCEVGQRVGDRSTFRFDQTFKVMRIEVLRPDAEVRWKCVDGNIQTPEPLSKPNEWIGTTIVFRFESEAPNGTVLRFEHLGLEPRLECYAICARGWDQFLDSLKNYAETGIGTRYK